jgi:hypothetical protein
VSTPALVATRTNSLHSTGPRTESGKAISRFNALRHGLTSEHLIIPGEDIDDFHALHSLAWQGMLHSLRVDLAC